jgi:hypothetical protein
MHKPRAHTPVPPAPRPAAPAAAAPAPAEAPRELIELVTDIDRLTLWPTLRLRCALLRRPT